MPDAAKSISQGIFELGMGQTIVSAKNTSQD